MSDDADFKGQTVDSARLLRPQTKMELIIDIDYLSGQADVRGSMILDITSEHVVASQTEPQILKSRIDQNIEATIVHHDRSSSESSRWGWSGRILGLTNEYRLNKKDTQAAPVSVIFLSLPSKAGLRKTNIRQAYRLDISLQSGIGLELLNTAAKVAPINFSAGGLMIGTPAPPPFALGDEVPFNLSFPATSGYGETTIGGSSLVVRLEYEPGEQMAKVGLKFMDLSPATNRSMEKIINFHMLEEQRKRNRM